MTLDEKISALIEENVTLKEKLALVEKQVEVQHENTLVLFGAIAEISESIASLGTESIENDV